MVAMGSLNEWKFTNVKIKKKKQRECLLLEGSALLGAYSIYNILCRLFICTHADSIMADVPHYIIGCYWPTIWSVLFPTMFPASLEKAGPKHSTSIPSSAEVAVPLSVDEKEGLFVPNLFPVIAVKVLPGPQTYEPPTDLCNRIHSLLPPTLQMVKPLTPPVTAHLKVKISPGQVGGTAVNCAVTSPGEKSAWKNSSLGTQLNIQFHFLWWLWWSSSL